MIGGLIEKYLRYLSFAAALFICAVSFSQTCVPDIFFHPYQGNTAIYPGKTITTPQNETVVAGSTLKIRGEFLDAKDGWITKLSSRGTVLWTKRYYMAGFNSGGFSTIENATDSTYLVTGRFGVYKRKFDGTLQELSAATFLLHIDKFGNLIWLKRISAYVADAFLSNITRLNNNSFLISGTLFNNAASNILLIKTDLSGTVAWRRVIATDSSDLLFPQVKKLRSGDVLLTGGTYRFGPGYSYITDNGYYTIRLNPATGDIISSKGFFFNRNPSSDFYPFDNVSSVLELPNDTIVLCTSFSEKEKFFGVPGVKEGLLIKTGINGEFYSADAYYNSNRPGSQLLDATYKNGSYTLLMDDGYETFLTRLTAGGQIINYKSYGIVDGNLKGSRLLDRQPDNRILFTGRNQVAMLGLMKTENDGSAICMETATQVVHKPVSSFFSTGTVPLLFINLSHLIEFEEYAGGIGRFDYPFARHTDCIQSCCDNLRSDTTITELCNARQYQLPDRSVVKESGMYYTRYSTANNCDSTAYHDIRFAYKPVADLGNNICMGDSLQVIIKADSGYYDYNWMGQVSRNHFYEVREPGKYSVTITNSCGTSSDEIEVFKECDFPVYIPSAFTPNNDGLNDIFRYPPENNNRFISMSIYNRYGQRIFYSTDKKKGWDGRFKNVLQPHDTFIYLFALETLDGRRTLKKGTIQLIR